ncbi:hypothetical protein C5167_020363 [Papaver somniferum]|uniref:GIY-YIG domain-containing protein n=1 Tax=Papaver somniferum TaxID=3469 RepID=A0A4Y7IUX4_PAPSO|nr:structure-specific endonuclease subunit SLX1 homolog [Papaver somniferum]RZC51936.1 hypothetical protein C5167_020363 [Papaver somniferum]
MILSKTFRSLKSHTETPKPQNQSPSSWSVYLIPSTNAPLKTYVGVTTNFSRRLKQHNGELKGGAKASRSGRPWICACIIQGFKDHTEACQLESIWKNFSRKLPRERITDKVEKGSEKRSLLLLQHRQIALSKVKSTLYCEHLEVAWKLSTSG